MVEVVVVLQQVEVVWVVVYEYVEVQVVWVQQWVLDLFVGISLQ